VDLVITDQRMPEMNGTDLLEVVQDYSPGTACMILSGFPDTTIIVEETQLRIERLISKPWDNAQLVQTIRTILAQRPVEEEAPAEAAAPPPSRPAPPPRPALPPPSTGPHVTVDCKGRSARDVIAEILPACSKAGTQGTRAVVVLRNVGLLNDSLSRLLKGLARAVAWSHFPIDLRDESGCVAAFVSALSRSGSVR
jgi:serine/threonine-protein kinase